MLSGFIAVDMYKITSQNKEMYGTYQEMRQCNGTGMRPLCHLTGAEDVHSGPKGAPETSITQPRHWFLIPSPISCS